MNLKSRKGLNYLRPSRNEHNLDDVERIDTETGTNHYPASGLARAKIGWINALVKDPSCGGGTASNLMGNTFLAGIRERAIKIQEDAVGGLMVTGSALKESWLVNADRFAYSL